MFLNPIKYIFKTASTLWRYCILFRIKNTELASVKSLPPFSTPDLYRRKLGHAIVINLATTHLVSASTRIDSSTVGDDADVPVAPAKSPQYNVNIIVVVLPCTTGLLIAAVVVVVVTVHCYKRRRDGRGKPRGQIFYRIDRLLSMRFCFGLDFCYKLFQLQWKRCFQYQLNLLDYFKKVFVLEGETSAYSQSQSAYKITILLLLETPAFFVEN